MIEAKFLDDLAAEAQPVLIDAVDHLLAAVAPNVRFLGHSTNSILPSSPKGLWVLEHWKPWVDPGAHDPAQAGEIRWPVRASDDSDAEIFFRTKEEALEHIAKFPSPLRDHEGKIIPPGPGPTSQANWRKPPSS
jgi:hypothetical protein